MSKLQLDIACGKNKRLGFLGVDIWEGADIVCNLEHFPWPFEDESVDEVFCSHYIEHTPDLIAFANELYRIMKVGAKAEIIAPYYSSIRAWQDPTHLRAISEATFLYFNKEWRNINKLDHYPLNADFDFECRHIIDPVWRNKEEDELNFAIRHYINVVADIHTILVKRSPENDEVTLLLDKVVNDWENGKFEDAFIACNSILKIKQNIDAYIYAGEYCLKIADVNKAITSFQAAIDMDFDSIEAHSGLLRSFVASGFPERAKCHVEELRVNNPDIASFLDSLN